MSACLLIVSGALQITDSLPADCAGYVLLSASEYTNLQQVAEALAMPSTSQMQMAFMAGITTPLICYLTAWGFAQVINFFRR